MPRPHALLVTLSLLVGCTPYAEPMEIEEPAADARDVEEPAAQVTLAEALEEAVAEADDEGVGMTPSDTDDEEAAEQRACELGREHARRAIARNRLALETFGYPASCRRDYGLLLRRELGVNLREVAGCVVDSNILGHARCFNAVMHEEITRRFGADALDRIAKAAGCG